MQEFDPNDIRLQAMNLLARREHLRAELKRKLCQRCGAEASADVERVLDELAEENLQSDQRFAESYIRSRSGKGYGPDRIRQELQQKGLPAVLLEEAMEAQDVDWAQLARGVREKKFGAPVPDGFPERARQMRFLAYRGFGGSLADKAFADDEGCWD